MTKYVKPGARVLELGCGIGLMCQEIVRIVGANGLVLGTDVSEDQVAIAQKLPLNQYSNVLHFQTASAYDLSGINGQYDVVYIRFLLMHLKDPSAILHEVKAVLKPGGFVLIEEIAGNDTVLSDPLDPRLNYIKKMGIIQQKRQQSNFEIALNLGGVLVKAGFKVVCEQYIQSLLDTLNNRSIFSVAMMNMRETLIREKDITEVEFEMMLTEVRGLEQDMSIKLYAHKIGQIVAQLS